MKYPVPENIRQFASIFRDNGHLLYIVGGAVRDHLLGKKNSDYDFCTDATPEQVISIPLRSRHSGQRARTRISVIPIA